MALWHPTITAYEVYGSRRERYTDKGSTITVTLKVDADDAFLFVSGLLIERYPFPYTGSDTYPMGCLRPISIVAIADRGKYNTAAGDTEEEVLRPDGDKYYTVTYGNDHRMDAYMWGQFVLIEETVTPHTQFFTMDYNKFIWSDGEPLRGADESPSMIFRTYKVNMTIERVFMNPPGGSGDPVFESLVAMNGTVNENAVQFYSLEEEFEPETVLCQLESCERYMETTCHDYDGTGSGSLASPDPEDYWWRVNLNFTAHVPMGGSYMTGRKPTWNKFYRAWYDKDVNTDKTGWYEIYHRKNQGGDSNVVLKVYPVTDDMEDVLRTP